MEYIIEKHRDGLNRADVASIAHEARQKAEAEPERAAAHLRRLFLASMIWGYADTDNRGLWRTKEMLRSPGLDNALERTAHFLRENRMDKAYDSFRQATVRYCGPAFSTKYLYFLGQAIDERSYPLILDSRVRESLELPELLGKGKLRGYAIAIPRHETKTNVNLERDEYLAYLNLMRQWAGKLD